MAVSSSSFPRSLCRRFLLVFLLAHVFASVSFVSFSHASAWSGGQRYVDDERGDVLQHDPDLLAARFRVTAHEVLADVIVYGAGAVHDVGFALAAANGPRVYVTPESVGDDGGPFPGCTPTLTRRSLQQGERFVLRAPRRCLAVLSTGPLRATVRLFHAPMYPDVAFRVVDVLEIQGVRLGRNRHGA